MKVGEIQRELIYQFKVLKERRQGQHLDYFYDQFSKVTEGELYAMIDLYQVRNQKYRPTLYLRLSI